MIPASKWPEFFQMLKVLCRLDDRKRGWWGDALSRLTEEGFRKRLRILMLAEE